MADDPQVQGLVEPGNIDLNHRPVIQNADGSHSSEYSTSFGDDQGREILVPTIVNGKFLTANGKKPEEGSSAEKNMFKNAQQHYEKTHEHMGIFDSPKHADLYADQVHNRVMQSKGPPLYVLGKSMAEPNDATIPTPLSNGTTDQPGGSQAAPPVPAGFSDTPVSAAAAAPAVPAGFSDTPQQDQSFWNKITHGGEASTPGQAEQFEQYKKDKWKSIINHVESGNLHGAAGEFLNLFQNPYGGGTAGEVATGALKSAGQTANTVSDVISHVLPKVVRPEDVQTLKGIETLKGAGEQTGAGLETLAEFMMGDEALKGLEGLTRTEKLAKLMPHMKMLENSPKLMRATKALYNISKMSGLTAGEAALHPEEGQTRGEAAQAGAIGGAVFGTGAEALSAGASSIPLIKNAIESTLRPTTETVGSTEVPVRSKGRIAGIVQKAAPETMAKFAQEQTGPAVAQGIGQVAKEAAGTEGVVSPDQHDRLGIRSVADEVKDRSQEVFKKLDEVSGNMLSEAQTMADDASGDFTSKGRKEYRQAMELQDAIFDNYKNHSELQGMDLDQAKADWRKQIALRDISKKLTGATESSETGNLDYQFKQGKQLSEAVDSLVKNDKDVLQRAGFTDDHIDQLQKFGRIIREQGQTPKFSGYMGAIAKTLAGAIGFHSGGWAGAMGGTAAEIAGEHAGRWLADRMLGKVLTTPAALPILTEGFSKNIDPAIVTNQLKSAIATADPGWAAKTGEILSNLWHDESGQLKIPGTEQTVGTAEGAKADTEHFANAKKELGEDASFSSIAKRAQEMKTQANLSGPGAEGAGSVEAINRANAEKAQGVKRVVVDTRTGQERPLIGVDAVDYQAKPYESVEFRGGDRDGEVIDQGQSVRPYERKYSGEERRASERKTMTAAELDEAMKNRKPIHTPFDDTEGVMRTIARDQNMPRHPGAVISKTFEPGEQNEYVKALKRNPQSATLTDPESVKNNRVFSNGEGVYYSISPEGDLQGVINNSSKKGALASVMPDAIKNGAKSLDAWDIYLPEQYEKYGFKRTVRIPYNERQYGPPSNELKNAWKLQGWKENEPYPAVQYMELAPKAKAVTGGK